MIECTLSSAISSISKTLKGRRSLLTLGLLSMILWNTPQAAAEKFAYVDLQRAVFEVDDGKAAKSRLEKMKTERQSALDGKQKELKKLQESLEKQADFLSDDIKQKKAQEFRGKLGELQAMYAKLQRELAEEEMKIQQQILGRMGEVLRQMGEESSYTMIIRKDALLWSPTHLDVTNELIRRYNESLGGKKSKKSRKKRKKRKK